MNETADKDIATALGLIEAAATIEAEVSTRTVASIMTGSNEPDEAKATLLGAPNTTSPLSAPAATNATELLAVSAPSGAIAPEEAMDTLD